MRVYTMLADGFEEVEAIAVIDLLLRAGIEVDTVSISDQLAVNGAHGIQITANCLFEEVDFEQCDMIFLPGGMPGTKNLDTHEGLKQQITQFNVSGKWLAAICAAPSVFGKMGILNGRKAICFPGFEEALHGAEIVNQPVVCDDHIFTSKGMGTAIDLGLAIIEKVVGKEQAEEMARTIQYK